MTRDAAVDAVGLRRAPASPTSTRKDGLDLYRLAYEEARRQVDAQSAELDRARSRAVAFLAFIGSGTAFLVGTSLRGAERDAVFYLLAGSATVLFFVSLTLLLEVLLAFTWDSKLRRFDWKFAEPSDNVLIFIDQEVPPTNELHLTQLLGYQYNAHWHHNRIMLGRLRDIYAACLVTGLAQLGIWVIVAWSRGAERIL